MHKPKYSYKTKRIYQYMTLKDIKDITSIGGKILMLTYIANGFRNRR